MRYPEILQSLGIQAISEGNHHCRRGWLQLQCPYCCSGNWHLGLNLASGRLSCWKCGPQATVATLARIASIPKGKVFTALKDVIPERYERLEKTGEFQPPPLHGCLCPADIHYLMERGFTAKEVQQVVDFWKIESTVPVGKYAARIYIPFYYRGEPVSFLTRSRTSHGLRYLSASEGEESVNHRELLYGEDFCSHTVVVQEGPIDVWAVGPGAVATCGTGYTRVQLARIARFPRRVICFDNEPTAQGRARKLITDLAPLKGETFNAIFETGKDAIRAERWEIAKLRKEFLE